MADPHRDPEPPAPTSLLVERAQELLRRLQRLYLAKDELGRLLVLSMIAGEHLLIIGPPGTAKSAMARTLARLVDARYFEYLLTRFTEPNELLGPVDLRAFREGSYRRRTEQMLPEAELCFLDEIFKANSAILNSLLSLLNERRVYIGGERLDAPLLSLFAASNEVPLDDSLAALLDRFLLRVRSSNVEGFHFQRLLELGLAHERHLLGGDAPAELQPILSVRDILQLRQALRERLRFGEDFLSRYKALLFQLRGEETRWVVGYRYAGFVRYQNWDPICRAPCGVAVDPNGVYSIRGMRIVPSASFLLPSSGLVRLEVDAGHTGARAGGVVLTTFGGITTLLGIVFTSLAGVGGTQGRSFLTGGLTTLALGGGMLTGGIAILVATRTKVRTGGLRLASVTPAWGAGAAPQALGAQ